MEPGKLRSGGWYSHITQGRVQYDQSKQLLVGSPSGYGRWVTHYIFYKPGWLLNTQVALTANEVRQLIVPL